MANFDDIIRETEAAEGAANPEFRPLGGSSVEEEIYEDLGGPAVSIETEVSKFLKNNQVFELVIGIEKDKLLTFADHRGAPALVGDAEPGHGRPGAVHRRLTAPRRCARDKCCSR